VGPAYPDDDDDDVGSVRSYHSDTSDTSCGLNSLSDDDQSCPTGEVHDDGSRNGSLVTTAAGRSHRHRHGHSNNDHYWSAVKQGHRRRPSSSMDAADRQEHDRQQYPPFPLRNGNRSTPVRQPARWQASDDDGTIEDAVLMSGLPPIVMTDDEDAIEGTVLCRQGHPTGQAGLWMSLLSFSCPARFVPPCQKTSPEEDDDEEGPVVHEEDGLEILVRYDDRTIGLSEEEVVYHVSS
jgi:hypothetical protein